jgi:hypothetical protein
MNRSSDFKLAQRRQQAIVVVGEIRHDVSNLCIPGYMPTVQREETRLGRVKSRHGALSLYPSTQNLPDIPIAELCFNKANIKKTLLDSAPASDHVRPHGMLDQSKRTPEPVDDEPDNEYERPLFEVSPGHWVELRGCEETLSALRRNFSRDVNCFCCDRRIRVIKDAAMSLCPECRTIAPFNDNGNGVGLGFIISEECAPIPSQFNDNGSIMGMDVIISEKDEPVAKRSGTKEDSLKDEDSNQSVHMKRAPTTKLGSRSSPSRRERS